MASRIMHIAITETIAEQIRLNDKNRLIFGSILPDFCVKSNTKNDSHLSIAVCGGQKNTYSLTKYRKLYGKRMKEDTLYLGYYLHLIQDIAYRNFVYHEYHWNPHIPGNVDRLHHDYRLLNPYLVKRYALRNNITVPDDFSKEPINELSTFHVQCLSENLKSDFLSDEIGKPSFFTEEMAMQYIHKAHDLCRQELSALRNGEGYLNEYKWAWNKILTV